MPLVFFDGVTILLPESEREAIAVLRSRFDAIIELGCGQEWEFANKARSAGVSERLVHLGNAVRDVTGQSCPAMIQAALDAPDATYAAWAALYSGSVETH